MRKLLRGVAISVFISGSLVMLGNWLWLVGIAVKPPDDLMGARWAYTFIAYVFSFMLFGMSETL